MFGATVPELQSRMTEGEFQSHRRQLAVDPEPMVKVVYLLQLLVQIAAILANAWGAKIRLTEKHLDPWEDAKQQADGTKARRLVDRLRAAFMAPSKRK